MRLRVVPSTTAIVALAAGSVGILLALSADASMTRAIQITAAGFAALLALALFDYGYTRRAWRKTAPQMIRRLPPALAIGVKRNVLLYLDLLGKHKWRCELYDHADSSLSTAGLPVKLTLRGGQRTSTSYTVTPARRGEVQFAPADVRVRSRLGLCEIIERLGTEESRRVYSDFAQVARYAWLAGDRRLQEIGVKTYRRRGEGTDFKQLAEYRVGDAVRHIDWKATLRFGKPIVREFQSERDQHVMLLIDCGRRMRADERQAGIGTSHFDQVLNAVMLLSYVALKQGDAVGAMTFGNPAGEERCFAPRKGAHALNALMGELYDVEPTPTHSDYVAAAKDLLRRQSKRALVIVITNFRDEDGSELGQALKLLRSRHLTLLANLRERVVRELAAQALTSGDAALEVASTHLYEQSRRDAFNRLGDASMMDAEPERLGIELVNRYQSMKRAGLI